MKRGSTSAQFSRIHCRSAAARQFQMAGNEISYDLRIQRFAHGLKIDRAEIASLFRKVTALVIDIGDTATHAGGEIPSARSQHEHHSLRHVLAAMIADALHHGGRSGVANRKSFSGNSVEKGFSAGCAIERNVSDQDVLFGGEPGSAGRIHHQAPTGQTLADVVVGLAFEGKRDTVRQKRTEALSRRSRQANPNRVVRAVPRNRTYAQSPR